MIDLPKLYLYIEDLGHWDEYRIWHRVPTITGVTTEPPAEFDQKRAWEWQTLEPSKRLLTLADKGYVPGLAQDYHGDQRVTMLKDGRPSTACLEYVRVPHEQPAFGRSKLTRDEIEYLKAWLLMQPGFDLHPETGRIVEVADDRKTGL